LVETSVSLHATDTDLGADLFSTSVNERADKKLIYSIAPPTLGTGYDFRAWYYVTIPFRLELNRVLNEGCVDTGCTISLINKAFL